LDLEPSQDSYEITVTKDGFSTDRTCGQQVDGTICSDSEGVPDPVFKNISVHQGELEEATFIIDQFSTLAVNSFSEQCGPIDNIEFELSGMDKKISINPEIFKNVITFTTDSSQSPHWSYSMLEWDRYNLTINTPGYDIAGINHDLALNIFPNTSTTVNVLLAAQTSNALLVTAKDSGTGINLSGANVRVVSDNQTYDNSKVTGQGFVEQSDWSGGDGQIDYIDDTKYSTDDGGVDTTSTSGQVTLLSDSQQYLYGENFLTGAYKDGGNTTADWDVASHELRLTSQLGLYPVGELQYAQTKKINSSKSRITNATLSVNYSLNGQSINYFLSADGGVNFESVSLPMTSPHIFTNVGDDLRLRIEMETSDENITPVVTSISLDFTDLSYSLNGELVSSTIDLGSAAFALSDFTTIGWQPVSQPPEAGTDSARFQFASNSDNSTWNYIGPDGTSDSYYTNALADLHSSHDGDRYVRYKMYLSTLDEYYTPTITSINFGYTLECLPPGQAFFSNTSSGQHIIEVSLDDYQDTNEVIDISGYVTQEILLTPIQ